MVAQIAQTNGTCHPGDEANLPCHPDDDDGDPYGGDELFDIYSLQVFIEKEQVVQDGGSVVVSFTMEWDQSAANSDGTPPSDTTYTLDSSKNMMDSTMEGHDPDHTNPVGR